MKKNIMKNLILAAVLAAGIGVPFNSLDAAGEPATLVADSVEYDMASGEATATGNVLFKQGNSRIAGGRARYNAKTQEASIEGNVIAIRDDMRITCAKITTDGEEHMQAAGDVHGVDGDKSFTGEQVDYYPNQNKYVLIAAGGTLTSGADTFTADKLEGWLDDAHYVGTGNAHLVSAAKGIETGGDVADYYGKAQGKVVLTGNAWATQENNTMKSNRLTIYLADNGEAKVK